MDATILIVDDEKSVRTALSIIMEDHYTPCKAANGQEALRLFKEEKPDVILLDIGLPDMDGMEVLRRMKEQDPDVQVIMITAVDAVKKVVEAIKLGAYDYLVKPINAQEVLVTVHNALESRRLKDRIRSIQKPDIERYKYEFIGRSPAALKMIEMARKVSRSSDTPILIVGESGSGKGVLARTIHYSDTPAPGPFVTVNCGAIPKDLVESELFGYERGAFTGAVNQGKKGYFEDAAGGTLFLDEIGAMSLSAQAKLLGVLEDRIFHRVGGSKPMAVSARIIAATNTDMENAVARGEFRQDLFYRLNVVTVVVPPLRERRDDIMLLTNHFMVLYNAKFGKKFVDVSPEAERLIMQYSWPGNVRELRNMVERIVLLEDGDIILPEHFHFHAELLSEKNEKSGKDNTTSDLRYEETIKRLISEAIQRADGNVIQAATILNMPVHKLRYRIKKLGVKV